MDIFRKFYPNVHKFLYRYNVQEYSSRDMKLLDMWLPVTSYLVFDVEFLYTHVSIDYIRYILSHFFQESVCLDTFQESFHEYKSNWHTVVVCWHYFPHLWRLMVLCLVQRSRDELVGFLSARLAEEAVRQLEENANNNVCLRGRIYTITRI